MSRSQIIFSALVIVFASLYAWELVTNTQGINANQETISTSVAEALIVEQEKVQALENTIDALESELDTYRSIAAERSNQKSDQLETTNNDNPEPEEELDIEALYAGLSPINKTELYELLNRERQNSTQQRLLSAQLTLNFRYGDFIKNLDLTENERTEITDLMKEHIAYQLDLTQQLRDEGISIQEYDRLRDEFTIEDALTGILTEQEMTEFKEYNANWEDKKNTRQIDSLSMALKNMSPGLSDENARLAAETTTSIMNEFFNETNPARTLEESQQLTFAGYDDAISMLSEQMTEDQLTLVREFFETQKQMMRRAEFE